MSAPTPPSPSVRLAAAEANATAARDRLARDLAEFQARLDPRLIAQAAVEQGREAGLASVETARRNPGAVAGAAGLVGILLLRKPLRRLFRRKRKVPAQVRAPGSPPDTPPIVIK